MASFLARHEAAFAWFGGRPRELLYDNPRTTALGREGGQVILESEDPRYLSVEDLEDFVQQAGIGRRAVFADG
jgi:transposase